MSESEFWETEEGWQERVCEPISRSPMAPRHAHRILEAAGKLASYGYSMDRVVGFLEGKAKPPPPRPSVSSRPAERVGRGIPGPAHPLESRENWCCWRQKIWPWHRCKEPINA